MTVLDYLSRLVPDVEGGERAMSALGKGGRQAADLAYLDR